MHVGGEGKDNLKATVREGEGKETSARKMLSTLILQSLVATKFRVVNWTVGV